MRPPCHLRTDALFGNMRLSLDHVVSALLHSLAPSELVRVCMGAVAPASAAPAKSAHISGRSEQRGGPVPQTLADFPLRSGSSYRCRCASCHDRSALTRTLGSSLCTSVRAHAEQSREYSPRRSSRLVSKPFRHSEVDARWLRPVYSACNIGLTLRPRRFPGFAAQAMDNLRL